MVGTGLGSSAAGDGGRHLRVRYHLQPPSQRGASSSTNLETRRRARIHGMRGSRIREQGLTGCRVRVASGRNGEHLVADLTRVPTTLPELRSRDGYCRRRASAQRSRTGRPRRMRCDFPSCRDSADTVCERALEEARRAPERRASALAGDRFDGQQLHAASLRSRGRGRCEHVSSRRRVGLQRRFESVGEAS